MITNEIAAKFNLDIYNIPDDLKFGVKWAVCTLAPLDPIQAKDDSLAGRKTPVDKAPRHPITGERLSVTEPEKWATFDECVNAGYKAVGFLLTKDDPYFVVDLDQSSDPAQNEFARKVVSALDTYAEQSVSGTGSHVIATSTANPGQGRRKGNVEMYSQERFIICTGKRLESKPEEIKDCTENLQKLRKVLDVTNNIQEVPIHTSQPETDSDTQIVKKMFGAKNGAYIRKLYEETPSADDDWSALDMALATHITFYTQNIPQALRIFEKSKLWRGEGSSVRKSGYERHDKYVAEYLLAWTFPKAWALNAEKRKVQHEFAKDQLAKLKETNDQEMTEKVENVVTDQIRPKQSVGEPGHTLNPVESSIILPEYPRTSGLIEEIAQYIYDSSPRPVRSIAMAGAISLVSAIAGRHYNINHSGLGLYSVILAKTGRGKESASSGVGRIVQAVSQSTPAIEQFIGPAHIASGQGLLRTFADDGSIPSKLLMLSEFGHTLKIITDRNANGADLMTRKVLLDMFSKTAWGTVVKEAAYSDKTKNTETIYSPNLTLMADTTPEMFFNAVDLNIINEGFLPRFLFFEYDGPRGKSNFDINTVPPSDLVLKVQTLVNQVMELQALNQHMDIEIAPEAQILLDKFDDFCDNKINQGGDSAELWNRAHLLALRIAGCVAVGNNFFQPIVSLQDAEWAIFCVKRSVHTVEGRINSGQFATVDIRAEAEVKKIVFEVFEHRIFEDDFKNRHVDEDRRWMLEDFGCVPKSAFAAIINSRAVFYEDSKGRESATRLAMRLALENGLIYEVDPAELVRLRHLSDPQNDHNNIPIEANNKLFRLREFIYCKGPSYKYHWEEFKKNQGSANLGVFAE